VPLADLVASARLEVDGAAEGERVQGKWTRGYIGVQGKWTRGYIGTDAVPKQGPLKNLRARRSGPKNSYKRHIVPIFPLRTDMSCSKDSKAGFN
jgi:hypothetical protein